MSFFADFQAGHWLIIAGAIALIFGSIGMVARKPD